MKTVLKRIGLSIIILFITSFIISAVKDLYGRYISDPLMFIAGGIYMGIKI